MGIIAVYNLKGGVGKTATSVNLAHLASLNGHKILLCDMDSQGSASYYFRIRPRKRFNVEKFLKGGHQIIDNIRGTDFEGLDLLPADFSFRNIDIVLDGMKRPRKRLRGLLSPLTNEYEHIILDCPPNLTLFSENLFYAADLILIPLIPTTLSALALEKLLDFFLRHAINRGKAMPFFSMIEKRKTLHNEVMTALRASNGLFAQSTIPYLAEIEKMGIYRQPVTSFSPTSAAANSYSELWREISDHPRLR